jgi:dTDP-L-rhamnose 4-epimerase
MYAVDRYVSVNDLGTAVLFQQLIAKPVKRVVVASSMSIYGEASTAPSTATLSRTRSASRAPARTSPGTRWTARDVLSSRCPRPRASGRTWPRFMR